MHVRILYFAVLRERLGLEADSADLEAGATVAHALEAIAIRHPSIAALLPRVQAAVNREIARGDRSLADGDEIALLPPVAGGSSQPRRIALIGDRLSLDEVVAAVSGTGQGGIVTFTGVVRRQGATDDVVRLEYEAFATMALAVLTDIADEIERAEPGVRVAIHHRTGSLIVGETAVVIATSAPHRAEAFAACRTAIERLKERAPIWKKEIGETGSTWIGMGP